MGRLGALVVTILLLGPAGAFGGDEVPADHAEQMAASLELFKADVAPLLKQHCIDCHGGGETHAEFDLSTREGLLKGGEHGPAAVAGQPGQSRLVRLVRHLDEPSMPMDADKLSDEAIAKLEAWIASGAAYDKPLVDASTTLINKTVSDEDRQFWSFLPLQTPAVPTVSKESWCRTSVDHFVLARLEEKGLAPNAPADRRKLIRRAYLDLVGLPPTPAEIDAFLADDREGAYERLIDRLLSSPHYGERWGRHWLDLARFAESHGYEQDYDRGSAYHYRDFVIRALNNDMPYDQFVRWQIAGDEYEPENPQALMATGFLGAGTHATQITANQLEKERYDELDDMTATVGTAMLGLTIGCARCHDHKFDPIPQADYYRLLSTFTTTVRSEVELDLQPEVYREQKAKWDAEHRPLAAALAKFESDELDGKLQAWLASDVRHVMPTWLVLDLETMSSDAGATFEKQDDGSVLVSGTNAPQDVYTFTVSTKVAGITAIKLEALADESLPHKGPGRAENGNFALSDFQLWSAPLAAADPGAPVKLVNPKVTYAQEGLPIEATLDDNKKSAWAVDGQIGKNQAAAYAIETPLANAQGTKLTFVLKFENNKGHNLGRLRISLSTETAGAKPESGSAKQAQVDRVNTALAKAPADRDDEDRRALLEWYRPRDPQWQELSAAVTSHAKQEPQPKLTKVMVTTEGLPAIRLNTQGDDFFEETYYLKRGDLSQKLGVAEQSFLQVLMLVPEAEARWIESPPDSWRTSYRRRSLAEWITDPQGGAGHLLARVIVNRLWQHHLGRGIVSTTSDFGSAGERPTHPELLDYLAGQLIAEGWRLKSLHKLIMTSSVYMQASETDAERAAVDPDNLLLWHRTRLRLEAEAIRDSMLATSGVLDARMYGPGLLDESQRRRSIYFTIKRSQLVPSMMLYDAPDSLQGLGLRATTIVAPQALAMLNNEQVQAYAKAFAQRLRAEGDAPLEELINRAYLVALAREADPFELAESAEYVTATTASYEAAGNADAAEQALADFCQVLYGLNEFIYID